MRALPALCALAALVGASASLTSRVARAQVGDAGDVGDGDVGAGDVGAEEAGDVEPEPLGPVRPPTREWEQILAAPRIGDRLSAVGVDPANPDHIFVGTEEGTIIRTRDGGLTWQEHPLTPFNVLARSVGVRSGLSPHRPPLGFDNAPNIDVGMLSTPLPIDHRARSIANDDDYHPGPELPYDVLIPPTMLYAAIHPRHDETISVERVSVCPGGRYSLLVATTREVYGSDDDGETFVRLFTGSNAAPFIVGGGLPQVTAVVCSPVDPEDIVVATSRGVMRSQDGGLTFHENITGATAGITTAVAWDEAGAEVSDHPALLVAMGTLLFAGDPDSQAGISYVYPDWNNIGMAPYLPINWVATTRSAQIWLGTMEGIRASLDGGVTWMRTGGPLFMGQNVNQIVAGFGHDGRERIAAVMGHAIYTTEDSGTTWDPYFIGMSRRTIRQAAAAGIDEDTGEGILGRAHDRRALADLAREPTARIRCAAAPRVGPAQAPPHATARRCARCRARGRRADGRRHRRRLRRGVEPRVRPHHHRRARLGDSRGGRSRALDGKPRARHGPRGQLAGLVDRRDGHVGAPRLLVAEQHRVAEVRDVRAAEAGLVRCRGRVDGAAPAPRTTRARGDRRRGAGTDFARAHRCARGGDPTVVAETVRGDLGGRVPQTEAVMSRNEKWWVATCAALCVAFAGLGRAHAQDEQDAEAAARAQQAAQVMAEMRSSWANEPSAAEVVQAALRHFRVERSDLDGLRRDARLRALLPTFGGDYTYHDNRYASFEAQNPTPLNIDQNSNSLVNGVTARVQWDPRELVFNGDQVNVYGLVGVQRDLMLEVLRAYFARRQLVLTVALRPPEDPIALVSLSLRIEEFTAVLDMLTGGWFTDTANERARGRRRAARADW